MRSVLRIKIHQRIFLKNYAADKPNGMKCDCIRIHALHGCVINNVIIQSTAIASLPATSFPGPYLCSSGEMAVLIICKVKRLNVDQLNVYKVNHLVIY